MMMTTGQQFKDTFKNKIYLRLYEIFSSWGQWFINNCDTEPIEFTEEEIEQFGSILLKNVEELAEIDE